MTESEKAHFLSAIREAKKAGFDFDIREDPKHVDTVTVYENGKVRCQGDTTIGLLYINYYAQRPDLKKQ